MHPDNADWTCFEQSASLEVKSFFGFESAVEKLAVKHYAQSIEKGKEIIEHYVHLLQQEGVTSVPVWSPAATASEDGASACGDGDGLRCESGSEGGESRLREAGEGDESREAEAEVEETVAWSEERRRSSVASQVMSKAKTKICFIYNVMISENMQRNESV